MEGQGSPLPLSSEFLDLSSSQLQKMDNLWNKISITLKEGLKPSISTESYMERLIPNRDNESLLQDVKFGNPLIHLRSSLGYHEIPFEMFLACTHVSNLAKDTNSWDNCIQTLLGASKGHKIEVQPPMKHGSGHYQLQPHATLLSPIWSFRFRFPKGSWGSKHRP